MRVIAARRSGLFLRFRHSSRDLYQEGTLNDLDLAKWAPEMPTVQEIIESMQNFGMPDYIIFAAMLVMCGIVGIYFGFVKKSSGEDEYLVGGRNMSTFPVSLSLLASFISGISLLGTPTEIYVHGTSYLFFCCTAFFVTFATSVVYLPVFHELKLTSTYEYLEKRFDKRIRLLGSVLFAISIITWLPIVIYVPALAFNQDYSIFSHRSKCTHSYTLCMHRLHILHLCGWPQGSSMDRFLSDFHYVRLHVVNYN
ncbi:sodium-coupled monocarboxylate transporter 1-like isoform X3 [Temnothorax nylanderi]|uniref:sodium-coupled monocarboxylate transporter 1-like isoform X3 n=1 Tax=Temnothorax nylanderi TaxID=102681 RepID=UPI003A880E14